MSDVCEEGVTGCHTGAVRGGQTCAGLREPVQGPRPLPRGGQAGAAAGKQRGHVTRRTVKGSLCTAVLRGCSGSDQKLGAELGIWGGGEVGRMGENGATTNQATGNVSKAKSDFRWQNPAKRRLGREKSSRLPGGPNRLPFNWAHPGAESREASALSASPACGTERRSLHSSCQGLRGVGVRAVNRE